jgi:hypothetical protein
VNKKSLLSAFVSLLLLLLLATFSSAVPVHATASWNVQSVDEDAYGYGNGYCPIVVDSTDNPHIAYTDVYFEERNQIPLAMYANWNGSGWNTQTVGRGTAFSLVLDSNNNPHLLYGGKEGLKYACWKGSNWTIQTADEEFFNGYGSLALDSSGNPHIAYTSRYHYNTTYMLKYGSWTGSNWSIQILDESSDIYRISLALDTNNVAYLLYSYTIWHYTGRSYLTSQTVKLAIYENSIWSNQTVVSNLSNYGHMVLDSQGFPHFIYEVKNRESRDKTLFYASWDGSAWNKEIVFSNVSLKVSSVNINMGGLALGSYDYPHIAYVTLEPNDYSASVMYASWTGRYWEVRTVDSNHTAKGQCYLAVGSNGNPHISYLITPSGGSGARANLMYATATGTTPTPKEPPQLLQTETIIGVAIIVAVIGVGLGLLIYFIKRK